MEIQTYTPETRTLDKTFLYDMIQALEAGLEYTQELLIKHDIELGRTTRSNKLVAEQMEKDIRKMKECIDKSKELR